MNTLQRQTRAAVDLGLLTRVLCHELNNLVANQRGYARLLERHPGGAGSARWQAELAAAAEDQHRLVAAVQHWTRQAAGGQVPAEHLSLHWPPPPSITALADCLADLGCGLPALALVRLLSIVADESGAAATDWEVPERGHPPAHGLLLGTADAGRPMVGVGLADRSHGEAAGRWSASAAVILPVSGATDDAWLRALALGLLRQSGGDLHFSPGPPAAVALWLPLAGPGLDIL